MNVCKIAFFGHRTLTSHRIIEERLYPLLKELIVNNSFVEFYVGRDGEFDILCASAVKQVQKSVGSENSALTLVLAYAKKDIEDYERYYSSVIIPECIAKIHPKRAITARNKWMIEESDIVLCYVEKDSGGAFTALKYAQKLDKKIINLADMIKEGNAD